MKPSHAFHGSKEKSYPNNDKSRGQTNQQDSSKIKSLLDSINLNDISQTPDIFDATAEEIADILSSNRDRNKASQIRQFYDEIVRFEQSHKDFNVLKPYIRMLTAKATYRKERKHVDENFVAFIRDNVRRIDSPDALKHFRLLFEAVLGFMPKK